MHIMQIICVFNITGVSTSSVPAVPGVSSDPAVDIMATQNSNSVNNDCVVCGQEFASLQEVIQHHAEHAGEELNTDLNSATEPAAEKMHQDVQNYAQYFIDELNIDDKNRKEEYEESTSL